MKTESRAVTFLGKGTEFEGRLKFEGTMRIDGHFKGEILSKGNLVLGEDSLVEADMHVSYIVVSGEVHGNIMADQRVDLRAPGKVFGNIQAPAVVIDQGVIFEGNTRMYRAMEALEKASALIASDEYQGEPPLGLTAIYGVVKDQSTDRPIKNARVTCKGSEKKHTETNASGYYEMINLDNGDWKLMVEAKGYRKEKGKVSISGEGTYRQNFELKPKG